MVVGARIGGRVAAACRGGVKGVRFINGTVSANVHNQKTNVTVTVFARICQQNLNQTERVGRHSIPELVQPKWNLGNGTQRTR